MASALPDMARGLGWYCYVDAVKPTYLRDLYRARNTSVATTEAPQQREGQPYGGTDQVTGQEGASSPRAAS